MCKVTNFELINLFTHNVKCSTVDVGVGCHKCRARNLCDDIFPLSRDERVSEVILTMDEFYELYAEEILAFEEEKANGNN